MEAINKRESWNKGKLVGQKPLLKPKDIWAIRIHLQNAHAVRDLAMFNLAIDSKLRGCDLVSLRVRDVTHGHQVLPRAMLIQRKTQRPVQFELTEPTRVAVSAWLEKSQLRSDGFLFPSRLIRSSHVSTRQYARIVHHWVEAAGLDSSAYGTHFMRKTKATLIDKRTKNLRAVQLLLGHSKLESTVRYLGIEVDDALEISEHTEISPAPDGRTSHVRPLSGIISYGGSRPVSVIRQRGLCDVERCECGGQLRILTAIEDPVVIVRILPHLGLSARAPRRAPGREPSLNHGA